ncbi:MAG: prepilin-type N-terminal cleavage/methylation domain-containing protein [Halanaerobiales bacterium]
MLMLPIGERGFTLLEVMIVIVLIAVIIAVNLPEFAKYLESIETRGQLLRVDKIFTAVKERSISQQKKIEVFLQDDQLIYRPDGEQVFSYDLEIVSRDKDKIIFYPDGTSSGVVFSLRLQNSSIHTVSIDSISSALEWSN